MTIAVVCAHNEAPRIAAVLLALVAVPELDDVFVMDDGSTDETAEVAASVEGVTVFRTTKNQGKGAAMRAGAARAAGQTDSVFFCDADLKGLKPSHVSGMVREFRRTRAAQVVGLRSHGLGALSLGSAAVTDIISGERIVDLDVLACVPASYWDGYQIETAINHAVDESGGTTVLYPLKGVGVVHKEAKSGVLAGFVKNSGMFANIRATKRQLRVGRPTAPTATDRAFGAFAAAASVGHFVLLDSRLYE